MVIIMLCSMIELFLVIVILVSSSVSVGRVKVSGCVMWW